MQLSTRLAPDRLTDGHLHSTPFCMVANKRTVFSFINSVILCFMRVYRLYAVHPKLGPKLVMIGNMMTELLVFIFILAMVLISYGVAMQSNLYPNRSNFSWPAVRDALYYPYFNLYGELDISVSMGKSWHTHIGHMQSNETFLRTFIGIYCIAYWFVWEAFILSFEG
ncbi:unnamed protein product [Protopolystoma xenopodis]|uniref:Ion transport domain-containing protein n=1 Tax=Protopolystoma xenopodis TaxID=117903 RepID=A0A3S5AYM1_9PLAT|nr:unnamed protein product [Protopolystoma xenopodis]